MIVHDHISDSELRAAIRSQTVRLAGNIRLTIFGRFDCRSGRRMNRANRVFFVDEAEAISHGYRPCGHCMRLDYAAWKADNARSLPAPCPST